MNEKQQYYAHGKLLITGEYLVLDGAKAFAIPCKLGQQITIEKDLSIPGLKWTSWDFSQNVWLKVLFDPHLNIREYNDLSLAEKLQTILKSAVQIQPDFLHKLRNHRVDTQLEFDRNWGLGSSSTLISLISQWGLIDPYQLLEMTFGGSGYDIACATAIQPILFEKTDSNYKDTPIVFNPKWTEQAYFIYLGQKQISSNEIKKYGQLDFNKTALVSEVSRITDQLIKCTEFDHAQELFQIHENKLSDILGYPTIKSQHFPEIIGTFKSLGAWGGDFVLFLGDQTEIEKIRSKGYQTIIPWQEMILTSKD